jgi:hypothetical protein
MASGYYGYKPKVRNTPFSEGKKITLHVISAKNSTLSGEYEISAILGGSTAPLKLLRDGKEYVLKISIPTGNAYTLDKRIAHVANEYLVFKLYEAAGVNVPEIIELVTINDTDYIGVLENFIENSTLKDILYPYSKVYTEENKDKAIKETFPIIQKDLLFHALFANWDINNNENIIIPKSDSGDYEFNKPIIIDCGGTLFFRAQGGYKRGFGTEVKNIETLVTSSLRKNDYTGKVYPMPLYGFTGKTNTDKKSIVCEKWKKDTIDNIRKTFNENKEIIRPYYDGKGYGTVDELDEILNKRIEDINKYCASVKNAPSNGAGGSSASAIKGGKHRNKTHKYKRHTKRTRRHHH